MSDHHHHIRLIDAAETYIERLRSRHSLLTDIIEVLMSKVAKLIATGKALIEERTALVAERDQLKVDLKAAQDQVAKDEADADAANTEMQAALTAETPAPKPSSDGIPASAISASVAAASTAPSDTVVVTGDAAVPVGAALSGPGIADGTTTTDVSTVPAVDGSTVSTITLSQPTEADHAGDQTETLVATPAVD